LTSAVSTAPTEPRLDAGLRVDGPEGADGVEVGLTEDHGDQRHQQPVDQRVDDPGHGDAHDEADGEVDEAAPVDELPELRDHPAHPFELAAPRPGRP
jgi:hypothetical protein